MIYINTLTSNAFQQFTLTGIPGVQINVLLKFMPRPQRWFMDVSYKDFTANGLGVVSSPNLLRQWRNIIPFGIACTQINRLDPYTINDFAQGSAKLYLLNSDDVAAIETGLFT